MRRYLLDTGIAGLYVARRDLVYNRANDEVRRGNVVGICGPVLGELYFGAENSASRDRSLQELRISLPSLRVWPFTNDAAAEFGRIAAELRRIGRPMQQIDIQIAAIAPHPRQLHCCDNRHRSCGRSRSAHRELGRARRVMRRINHFVAV